MLGFTVNKWSWAKNACVGKTHKVLPSLVKHAIKNMSVFISTKQIEKKSDSLVDCVQMCIHAVLKREDFMVHYFQAAVVTWQRGEGR